MEAPVLTEEAIKELETTHKRVAHLHDVGGEWEIVLRKPTRPEYKHFRAMINGAQASDAQEMLVRKLCVYPDRETFDALLEDWPGIPEACGAAIKSLTGMSASEDLK